MKLYTIHRKQVLPVSLFAAWEFMSDPANLARITPPFLGFRITSAPPGKIYPGAIITYTIRPIAGIRLKWITEITHVVEPNLFVDEQRFGPYRFWHHEHHFDEAANGTTIEDIVYYALRGTLLAPTINRRLVQRRLTRIFDFREQALQAILSRPLSV